MIEEIETGDLITVVGSGAGDGLYLVTDVRAGSQPGEVVYEVLADPDNEPAR